MYRRVEQVYRTRVGYTHLARALVISEAPCLVFPGCPPPSKYRPLLQTTHIPIPSSPSVAAPYIHMKTMNWHGVTHKCTIPLTDLALFSDQQDTIESPYPPSLSDLTLYCKKEAQCLLVLDQDTMAPHHGHTTGQVHMYTSVT